MAFYSHPPHIQLYAAYTPMAIPNQPEFYAVYPPGGHPGMGSPLDASAFYYDSNPKGMMAHSTGKWDNFHFLSATRFLPVPRLAR